MHELVSFTPQIELICACNLQIFSGCVCHLEQLHAQSPFLFPIALGINNLFLFSTLAQYWLSFVRVIMRSFTWANARSHLSLFVALARCFTACCHIKSLSLSLSLSLFPQPPLPNESVIRDGRKHKTIVFLQSNTFREQAWRFSLLAAANGLENGSGELRASPFNGDAQSWNGIERSLSRAVVPQSLPVSARLRYHVSNSVVFVHRTGTLTKRYPLSKLFSKAELLPFEKGKCINLVCSSCLKHAKETWLGDPWHTYQRTQNFNFSIVMHQSLDSAAEAPRSLSLHARVNQSSTVRFLTPTNAPEHFSGGLSHGSHTSGIRRRGLGFSPRKFLDFQA